MKKYRYRISTILYLLLIASAVLFLPLGCASMGSSKSQSEIVITSSERYVVKVIDEEGDEIASRDISPNETVSFRVPNGKYYITYHPYVSTEVPDALYGHYIAEYKKIIETSIESKTKTVELPDLEYVRIILGLNDKLLAVNNIEQLSSPDSEGDKIVIRGGSTVTVDINGAVKKAFAELDPVFQQNLKPNAAVAVFPISTHDMRDAEMFYEQLQINIVDANRYVFIEKSKVDALLEEYDFQRSGLVSTEAQTIGELLDADVVIFGSITGNENGRSFVIFAVDVANRATLASADVDL